jgi:hypothetical protein
MSDELNPRSAEEVFIAQGHPAAAEMISILCEEEGIKPSLQSAEEMGPEAVFGFKAGLFLGCAAGMSGKLDEKLVPKILELLGWNV